VPPRHRRHRRSARPTPRPFDVALAATLHDPAGALAEEIRARLPRLQSLYRTVAVAASPVTAPAVCELLAAAGALAPTPAANLRGPLYRSALRHAAASGATLVHYVDFDRALRWVRRVPRELAGVLRASRRHPVLLVGRTHAAHRSHHLPLYATETLANRLMAGRLGLAGRVDLLVPSFVLARSACEALLRRSRARDVAIYGELAALVLGIGPDVAYVECRGLDWETPDRYRRAVRRIGLSAWRRRQETPAEWALRVELARDIVRALERTLVKRPVRTLRLRRLPPRAA
jgi:hypothetical protein